jgi:hypothetical protein
MKAARIALGLVAAAGMLAFLIAWMGREERYAPDPLEITTRTYDSSSLDRMRMMIAVNGELTARYAGSSW